MTPLLPLPDELLGITRALEAGLAAVDHDPITDRPLGPVTVDADVLVRASRLLRTAADVVLVAEATIAALEAELATQGA